MNECSYTWENVQISDDALRFFKSYILQYQIYAETVAMNSVNSWYEFECN